ncbi:substrate-binding domain-containing protein, partial [Rhizobium johnstonii]|uniref:substrate-binding domain-containing protein n=1 Tax=Rhizobium johnstonii TaxID=3019933 RepID=UPI003F9B663F
IGAMKAFRAAGVSIPGQIALIVFDDIPTAELLSPSLTTLRVQKREMGEEAVRLLLSRIATRNRHHGIVTTLPNRNTIVATIDFASLPTYFE